MGEYPVKEKFAHLAVELNDLAAFAAAVHHMS
jgi:hypothetical protein